MHSWIPGRIECSPSICSWETVQSLHYSRQAWFWVSWGTFGKPQPGTVRLLPGLKAGPEELLWKKKQQRRRIGKFFTRNSSVTLLATEQEKNVNLCIFVADDNQSENNSNWLIKACHFYWESLLCARKGIQCPWGTYSVPQSSQQLCDVSRLPALSGVRNWDSEYRITSPTYRACKW